MGGTISVDSKPGVGSAFTVECIVDCVPSDVAPTTDQQAEEDKDALLDGRHVLLCEDHPLNQEIAKALLQEKGMTVDLAENGQRGVEVFSQSPIGYYDAILMDIRMPILDGYGAARAIRALSRPDAGMIPILAMSADVLTADVKKCFDAGMNGHVAKPIDPAALRKALEDAIQKRA